MQSFPHHEWFMRHCLALAGLGRTHTAPNPMVGAVLVHQGKIVSEGYHMQYGGPHAEVNCLQNLPEKHKAWLPQCIMYVSLEPCAHFGKTPPCADLLVKSGIRKVVMASLDPFAKVNGAGIAKLQSAGIDTVVGVLEKEAWALNEKFFFFHQHKRPFITLKWAETADGFIAASSAERLMITGPVADRFTHSKRAEHMAILAGYNTVLNDDPLLDARHAQENAPILFLIDKYNTLPIDLRVFALHRRTVVFTLHPVQRLPHVQYVQSSFDGPELVNAICNYAYSQNIISLFVEGGAATLQMFIDAECYNQCLVLVNHQLSIGTGLRGPKHQNTLLQVQPLHTDTLYHYLQHPLSLPAHE